MNNNQFFLGGMPPLNTAQDIDTQLQLIDAYKSKLNELKGSAKPASQVLIWDEIDSELNPLTPEQKSRLFQDDEYRNNNDLLQTMVQGEILNLVKPKIEGSPSGREILNKQLNRVKELKGKIIQDTTNELQIFNKFREYAKTHPETTYDEFVKNEIL